MRRKDGYQYFSIEQRPGLSLENFTAVDDFYCRAAAQTLRRQMCNMWSTAEHV